MANTTGKKYGGRKKGTSSNKLTKEIRTVLKDILYHELEHIDAHLDKLEPKERIELIIKMMPFVLPKIEHISHSNNEPLDWSI